MSDGGKYRNGMERLRRRKHKGRGMGGEERRGEKEEE